MSEKTEQPTSKKLRDSRQKGDVAYSKDFTQTLLILAIFGYLVAASGRIVQALAQMIVLPSTLLKLGFNEAANTLVESLLREAAWVVLPFIGAIVAVILGHAARGEIRRAPAGSIEGDGLAIAGLVLGYIQLVLCLLALLAVGVAIAIGVGLLSAT